MTTSYSVKHCLGNNVMISNFLKLLHDIISPKLFALYIEEKLGRKETLNA